MTAVVITTLALVCVLPALLVSTDERTGAVGDGAPSRFAIEDGDAARLIVQPDSHTTMTGSAQPVVLTATEQVPRSATEVPTSIPRFVGPVVQDTSVTSASSAPSAVKAVVQTRTSAAVAVSTAQPQTAPAPKKPGKAPPHRKVKGRR